MKTIGVLTTVVATLMSVAVFTVQAKDVPGNHGQGAGMNMHQGREMRQNLKKELQLTDDQEKKMQEHRRTHQEKMNALREQMQAQRDALKKELDKPQSDAATLTKISNEMKTIAGKLIAGRLDGILEIKKILTPGQFQKLGDHQQKMRQHMKHPMKDKGGMHNSDNNHDPIDDEF
ncbi:MAG: hypothetical protein A2219_03665 [Elusimicrobia bacterium RIFOXYA2_FULL_50_26]|nr:MAG: hypothetical protein A2219_03665 [Elusimicrobia bacterium RIFOXYA2_FULL_50_26]OGS22439.1 MAG: hypothetical protein A2314_07730 [Elusimicrobia bacterium RIFOXYB2_FULL_50_12]